MPVHEKLKPYAAKLGFPESENLAGIFSILFDDEKSLLVAAAIPGSVKELKFIA